MKALITTAALIVAASTKSNGRDDRHATSPSSQLEIVSFQKLRKLPT
jgi:hypothetical protein